MTVFLPKGQVWKRVWTLEVSPKNGFGKMTLFWSEIENQTAQPHQEFSGVPFPLKSFQRSLPWCAWFEGHMKSRLWFKLSTPMHRDLIPRSPEDSDYQIPPPPPPGRRICQVPGYLTDTKLSPIYEFIYHVTRSFVKHRSPPAWRDFEKLSC